MGGGPPIPGGGPYGGGIPIGPPGPLGPPGPIMCGGGCKINNTTLYTQFFGSTLKPIHIFDIMLLYFDYLTSLLKKTHIKKTKSRYS